MVLRPYPNQTKVHKVSPLHDFLHSSTNPLFSSLMSQLNLTFEFKVKGKEGNYAFNLTKNGNSPVAANSNEKEVKVNITNSLYNCYFLYII